MKDFKKFEVEETEVFIKIPKKKKKYLMIPIEKIEKIEEKNNIKIIFIRK